MATTFSHPKDWNYLKELCLTYPRHIAESKIIRFAVEHHLEFLKKKSNQTITDFADKYPFGLDSDIKLWKTTIKEMDAAGLRDLQKLLKKREGLVSDEVYKRTR